jgi:hypothetical protein
MVFGFEPYRARCTWALGQALCAPCSITELEKPCSFIRWSCPYIHTKELDDAALYVPGQIHDCPPLNNKLLCRDHTEQK